MGRDPKECPPHNRELCEWGAFDRDVCESAGGEPKKDPAQGDWMGRSGSVGRL